MKRFMILMALVAIAATSFAQKSAAQLAKERRELNSELRKNQKDLKITKSAKQQSKALKKDGWQVPAGESSMEIQFTKSEYYAEEEMEDEEGNATNRYYQHTAMAQAGSYNLAMANARAVALNEVASMMETQLVAAWQLKGDNDQGTTNEKFNERVKAIVDQSITNARATVQLYRRINGNFEGQVRLLFDKKELSARLKRQLKKELEEEGDELNEIVDDILKNHF